MEEGLNFKIIFNKIKTIINYLLSKWVIISFFIVIGAILGVYLAKKTPKQYNAQSTFMINSSKGSGNLSSLLGMASSLGLGGSTGSANIENVSEIIISNRIIINTLLNKVKYRNHEIILGNYFIEKFKIRENWVLENKEYQDITFTATDIKNLSPDESLVFTLILKKIKSTISVDFEKQSGIISLSSISDDEFFSHQLTNLLIEELTTFYVNRSTQNERETFTILSNKTDSIKSLLESSEIALAKLKDNSFRTVKAIEKIQEIQLEREIGILSMMYSTSVTNVEMARVNLLQKKPFIQVIDAPISPLKVIKKSSIINAIMFSFLFGFLIVSFFIAKHEIKQALK